MNRDRSTQIVRNIVDQQEVVVIFGSFEARTHRLLPVWDPLRSGSVKTRKRRIPNPVESAECFGVLSLASGIDSSSKHEAASARLQVGINYTGRGGIDGHAYVFEEHVPKARISGGLINAPN